MALPSGFADVNFLSKARSEILNRSPVTRASADTTLSSRDFYENDLNQQIATNEMGGKQVYRDSMDHIRRAEELRREEGKQETVSELKPLM